MKLSQFGILVVLTLVLTGMTIAQTATPGINAREREQRARIRQGVRSGELTAGEEARLKLQQAKIRKDERRAKADGKVTRAERKKLTREQNRASRTIHRKKHNAREQK